MSIRCKFKLESITHLANDARSLTMTPVTSGSEENKQFFKWTPSGKLEVYSVNAAAVDGLELGAEYYIDITPAK
jgi:hypothetical protein